MDKMNKRGQVFGNFTDLVKGGVVIAMFLVVGFLVFSNVAANTQVAADGNATLAITTIRSAVATIPGWIPLLILVVIAAVILALVNRFGNR